jgi:hypothetical protein
MEVVVRTLSLPFLTEETEYVPHKFFCTRICSEASQDLNQQCNTSQELMI